MTYTSLKDFIELYFELLNVTMSEKESETAKETARLLKSEMATRRGKLGVCTRQINELRTLLVENGDVDRVEKNMQVLRLSIED